MLGTVANRFIICNEAYQYKQKTIKNNKNTKKIVFY